MSSNDSKKAEFASCASYKNFAKRVLRSRRYVLDDEGRCFLDAVLATLSKDERDRELPKGQIFYRAQRGVEWLELEDENGNSIGPEVFGYDGMRMKPLSDRAREGRLNPSGIPVLYVANTIETAISEVRPWVGAEISVAKCRLVRPLKTLNLSIGHGKHSGADFRHFMGGPEPTTDDVNAAVWIDIDNAFSRPITASDDQADYAPTQILAELFQSVGYEAIVYKSQFGDNEQITGYNIAIFDLDAIEIVSCEPHQVESIKINARQIGNPWFSSKNP